MIASVTGEVVVRRADHVVIDASGVGYRLAVSAETLRSVPECGQRITLYSHLVSREDSLSLYGFASDEERLLFLSLTSVSGVGPKVALAALSSASPQELLSAILAGDSKRFQAVPGIGKRTAERIILELKDRVAADIGVDPEGSQIAASGPDSARSEARDGLVGLGYSAQEAEQLLDGYDESDGVSAEELLQGALKRAGGGEP